MTVSAVFGMSIRDCDVSDLNEAEVLYLLRIGPELFFDFRQY